MRESASDSCLPLPLACNYCSSAHANSLCPTLFPASAPSLVVQGCRAGSALLLHRSRAQTPGLVHASSGGSRGGHRGMESGGGRARGSGRGRGRGGWAAGGGRLGAAPQPPVPGVQQPPHDGRPGRVLQVRLGPWAAWRRRFECNSPNPRLSPAGAVIENQPLIQLVFLISQDLLLLCACALVCLQA